MLRASLAMRPECRLVDDALGCPRGSAIAVACDGARDLSAGDGSIARSRVARAEPVPSAEGDARVPSASADVGGELAAAGLSVGAVDPRAALVIGGAEVAAIAARTGRAFADWASVYADIYGAHGGFSTGIVLDDVRVDLGCWRGIHVQPRGAGRVDARG